MGIQENKLTKEIIQNVIGKEIYFTHIEHGGKYTIQNIYMTKLDSMWKTGVIYINLIGESYVRTLESFIDNFKIINV